MAQLRKAIETIDPKPDKKKEQTLLLTLLAELCEQHARRLHKEVKESLLKAGTEGHIGLPVTHTLREHTEQRAYVRDDAGKIATHGDGPSRRKGSERSSSRPWPSRPSNRRST